MKAIGYVRVSTDQQAERGVSLEAQEAKIRAMAIVQGAELIDVIVDGGESAKSLNRPGLQRLLGLVNSGAVNAVIVAKLDRLTRSVKDLCELLELFEKRKVALRARDPGSIYLYSEHYQGQGEPASHAQAILGRGAWIPGVIDPACLGSSQIDGRTLMEIYRSLGLSIFPAVNAVEAGITEVWNLLVSGRLKVMVNLTNWLREFRKYHRDDKGSGKIVKRDDHLMDATRYLIVSGRMLMKIEEREFHPNPSPRSLGPNGWMRMI